MKKLIFVFILSMLTIVSFAQTTREQADETVLQYIRSEIGSCRLFEYIQAQTETLDITPTNGCDFSVRYPSWAYSISLGSDSIDGSSTRWYLFVSKHTGKLFAVKTTEESGPVDPSTWAMFRSVTSIQAVESSYETAVYPNPVGDVLTIQGNADRAELYDLAGNRVLREDFRVGDAAKLNVALLSKGTYVLSVFHRGNVKSYKIIKK
ncbi:MAG: T9SS type A sorting domain-containing protein [Bacteroidales bacterium]|jgi:hypothetical protein|nr:T9SS type A sorting domain-containing protein [Bacteroidales bacterium]